MIWSALRDEAALAATYRAAKPFPHFIVDDFIAEDALPDLLAILEEEPVETRSADFYLFDASDPTPKTAALLALRESFAATLAPALTRITGEQVSRVDMRAYAYRPGHYLLPHSDHAAGISNLQRKLAYVVYVPSPEPPTRGELELFDGVTSAKLVEPRGNRLIVFEVSDASLHCVREVMSGLRISLAGWFYA